MEPKYPIRIAAARTGLSTHLIRIWERRYKAIEPERTDTGRRMYTDDDISRLTLLRRATRSGANIGQIAQLSDTELAELAASYETFTPPVDRRTTGTSVEPGHFVHQAEKAIDSFNADAIDSVLRQASVSLGRTVLFEKVLRPILTKIGDKWEAGTLTVAHEHLLSAVVRSFLGRMAETTVVAPDAPMIVVGTPSGQRHEFGALMAAVTAASTGWRPVYLGPDLPSDEIALAANFIGAEAVALSLIYPPDDHRVDDTLRSLRRSINEQMPVFVGGRARGSYRAVLEEIKATVLNDFGEFTVVLEQTRNSRPDGEDT